jgi:hypothetical protein
MFKKTKNWRNLKKFLILKKFVLPDTWCKKNTSRGIAAEPLPSGQILKKQGGVFGVIPSDIAFKIEWFLRFFCPPRAS